MVQTGEVLATWHSADFLGGAAWRLTRSSDALTLTTSSAVHSFVGAEASRLIVSRWLLGHALVVSGPAPGRFRGVRRHDVDAIRAAVAHVVARAEVVPVVGRLAAAGPGLTAVIEQHVAEGRWIPYDTVAAWLPPEPDLLCVEHAGRAGLLTAAELGSLRQWGANPWNAVRAANETIVRAELASRRDLFDRVETTPLTEEQARAVVTFDNRVRVIAAAGSGKTSVMVARAAYAVARGLVAPERILLLAFNADAAAELQTRVTSRLAALGLPGEGVRASTFHAFGRSLIGEATGRKPSIASWVEAGGDTEKVTAIIDELRAESADFRLKWDVFRLLYARLSSAPDGGVPDNVDRGSRTPGFRTFRGETVRSEGERLIADWLFLNGVEYRYEQPYAHEVADAGHAQYRPDSYYPQIDVWHEHWALRADGTPPESFVGYADAMAWKRATHRRYGTTLLETTWHEIIELQGFKTLAAQLTAHGARLNWNPDRLTPGATPVEPERLARLMRTFLAHVKANGLTRADLNARLTAGASPRSRLFVELYWRIHDRWEQHLRDAEAIDFDDMLLQAAGLLETDPSLAAFDLVLVDEFQDTSQSRARLVRALTRRPGSALLTVGDDWQAINRFAGADLGTMTHFEDTFGPGQTLYLQTTFRNPQRLADVAGRFVSRNPAQLRKTVTSHRRDPGQPVFVVRVRDRNAVTGAIRDHLRLLATQHPGSTVDVLGRYRRDRMFVPREPVNDLKVTFRTIHAAKGLEADHVIVANLTSGSYGFPSRIDDDPVLQLAMTAGDDYPDAEERRLFYVALTRARHSVALFTVAGHESPFVAELLNDPDVVVHDTSPAGVPVEACPDCHQGILTQRNGRYGTFLGCSGYPACTYTRNLERSPRTSTRRP